MFPSPSHGERKTALRSTRRRRPGAFAAVAPRLELLESRILLSTLPAGFSETVIASSVSSATAMQFSPDGKLFVAEQAGTMEVWESGVRLRANFFQDTPLSTQTVSERGLLGVTFDPDYATNRFVYVYYTTPGGDNHNRVSRFTANAAGDLALAGSEFIIMELDAHSAGNHNGGAMHFGLDGMLYIATGDNASGANAQSLANRHGKMLRVDVDGDDFPADAGNNYRIPAGQPTSFPGIAGTTSGVNRSIWNVGLRNPFTFAVQPGTGRLFINDVGQNTWEEINDGLPGVNYGWPSTEGDFNQASFPNFTRPFYTYDHGGAQPNGVAITGGTFYNPTTSQFPAQYVNDYFFADFGGNRIWHVDLATKAVTEFASNISAPVDLKSDANGNLYYLARGTGQVFRVSYTAAPPTIIDQPDSQTITEGDPVTFSVAASGAAPFTYQWQRAESGGAFGNIGGATSSSFTIPSVQPSDSADQFRVIVTDTAGQQTTSNVAVLTVTVNQPPMATINITGGLRNGNWDAGSAVSFSGSATDVEDGTLGAASFTWQVDYLTTIDGGDADMDGLPGITRPFLSPGDIGQVAASLFTPAVTGPYTLTDVAHVITLTVTDSQGLIDVERIVIDPNTATLTVTTSPAGLQITVDGQPFAAPHAFDSVVGFERPIGAAAVQPLGGTDYHFVSWSDAGAVTHTIATPISNTTYTAAYQAAATLATPVPPMTDVFVSAPFATWHGNHTVAAVTAGGVMVADMLAINQYQDLFYLRLTSGGGQGLWTTITSNTTHELTLEDAGVLAAIAAGDTFGIYAHQTLATVLPDDMEGVSFLTSVSGFMRGTEVIILDSDVPGLNKSAAATFFHLNGEWRRIGQAGNFDDFVLPPDSGFILRNNDAQALTFTVSGRPLPPVLARLLPVFAAPNDLIAATGRTVPVTLAQLNLGGTPAFASSPDGFNRTDELFVFDNAATGFNKAASAVYYYSSNAWRKVGFAGAFDDELLAAGMVIFLRKEGATPGTVLWQQLA